MFFNPLQKGVILSEAPRRSIAIKEFYGAKSKDPGDALLGRCSSELSGHELQGKSKSHSLRPGSVVEGPAVSLSGKNKRESERADRTVSSKRIGIIMHGITGRMGYNQHLVRSIVAIREQGGVALSNGDRVMPDPILVGRNLEKVSSIAARHGIKRVAKDISSALADPEDTIFFDAGSTQMRVPLLTRAIEAGKHVYCEKPLSETLGESLSLMRLAKAKGVKSGVVQDKLYLPGLRKLRMLKDAGFFGRILSVRGEFGYWVFEGDLQPAQRPSWNYRKADGGGIILDMLPHWRYVLDNLFGAVEAISCIGATHIAERFDESGAAYKAGRGRRGLCDLPVGRRCDRHHQFILGGAGTAR